MSRRRSHQTRRRRAARLEDIRFWNEAPKLADWILAPLETNGVETCEHLLEINGTSDDLTQDAAYVPQADPRVTCADCNATAMVALADAIAAGRLLGRCAVCGETHRDLTHWQTPPAAAFVVAAWICTGCSSAAGAIS